MLSKWQKLLYNMSMFSPFFLLSYGWNYIRCMPLSVFDKTFILFNFLLLLWYFIRFLPRVKSLKLETIKIVNFSPSDIKIFDFGMQMIPVITAFFNTALGITVYASITQGEQHWGATAFYGKL